MLNQNNYKTISNEQKEKKRRNYNFLKKIPYYLLGLFFTINSNAQNIDSIGKVINWGSLEITVNSYTEDNEFSYFKLTLCNKGTTNINPMELLYHQGLREDEFYETDERFSLQNGVKTMWKNPEYYSKVQNIEEILPKRKWKRFKLKADECVVWNCKFNKIDRNRFKDVTLVVGNDYYFGTPVVKTIIRLHSAQDEIQYLANVSLENEKKQIEREKQKIKDEEERVLYKQKLERTVQEIKNGTFNGHYGWYAFEDYRYNGYFKNGIPHGEGNWEKDDGSSYKGNFENGVENGQGTLKLKNGLQYTGNFTNGVPNGQFNIAEYGLFGLVSNKWTATYEMGKLISSNQTGNSLDELFSGKSSSYSPSKSSTSDENETSKSNTNSNKNIEVEIKIDRSGKKCCYALEESYCFDLYVNGKMKASDKTISKSKLGYWHSGCAGLTSDEFTKKDIEYKDALIIWYEKYYDKQHGNIKIENK